MTYQPRFLYNSGVTFVTMPCPDGDLTSMIPEGKVLHRLGVIAEIIRSDSNMTFMLLVTSTENPNLEPWIEPVRRVLEHMWDEMIKRKLVTGIMPVIERINLFDIPFSA